MQKYDIAWRAGANSATKITFSTDVVIAGKDVKKGTYSLFITPKEGKDWDIHVSSGSSVFAYDEDGKQNREKLLRDDVATVATKPTKNAQIQERLRYTVEQISEEEAKISMTWEYVTVSFMIQIKTPEIIASSLEKNKPVIAIPLGLLPSTT